MILATNTLSRLPVKYNLPAVIQWTAGEKSCNVSEKIIDHFLLFTPVHASCFENLMLLFSRGFPTFLFRNVFTVLINWFLTLLLRSCDIWVMTQLEWAHYGHKKWYEWISTSWSMKWHKYRHNYDVYYVLLSQKTAVKCFDWQIRSFTHLSPFPRPVLRRNFLQKQI